MKDCKCGRIPSCYGGRMFSMHEELEKIRAVDETHDMVYELNKQMCDLEKRLSDPLDPPSEETMKRASDVLEHHLKTMRELNRKSRLPIEVTEEHIKIINRLMEEKKTKKMTKAEAFEYLKGKRVVCDGLNNEDVQRKLFEVGLRWRGGKKDVTAAAPFLYINPDGITHGGSFEWFNLHEYEEISADDILSIEIVEDEPLDKWDDFARRVAKIQETLEDDEVCIITKGNFLTMTK